MSRVSNFFKKYKKHWWKIAAAIVVIAVASCSTTIDSIDQPASINGGETLPVTLNVKIVADVAQTSKLMVGMLVPKVWKVSGNTSITFTSDITTGPQKMTLIPAGEAAPQGNGLDWPTLLATRIGNGGNLLNEYEWVAFYSDQAYSIGGSTINVHVNIQTKVSNDNLSFKLGYVVANSSDGLSSTDRYGTYFPGCFQVIGTGDLIDFCNPQLSTVEPRAAYDNDIITVNFDGGVVPTGLDNASQIYLCATGTLTDGTVITKCIQNTGSALTQTGVGKWRIDIWPRQFFALTDAQHLSKMEYFFTDASGNIKIGYGGGEDAFKFTFNCQ